jgi:hypothetical protein
LLDAIHEAGNLSIKAEDARLSILRQLDNGEQKVFNINASPLIELTDVSQNISLQEGDLINITPKKTQTVLISGEVKQPGPYEVQDGEGLAQLITRAGGATDDAAVTQDFRAAQWHNTNSGCLRCVEERPTSRLYSGRRRLRCCAKESESDSHYGSGLASWLLFDSGKGSADHT